MDEKNVIEILSIILNELKGKEFTWRIEGSANLMIQGVSVPIRDLDITTNDEGIEIFRDVLNKYLVRDFFNKKVNGLSLVYDINGFEVEVNSYGDREKNMFDKVKNILWHELDIPILPLKYAKMFYEAIGQKEKVDLISNYLD